MGYRLYAKIPNVNGYDEYIQLGKQYDGKWDNFNNKWFGNFSDGGLICPNVIEEFYNELIDVNNQAGNYPLYNLEVLKEMVDYAIENNYDVFFESF